MSFIFKNIYLLCNKNYIQSGEILLYTTIVPQLIKK